MLLLGQVFWTRSNWNFTGSTFRRSMQQHWLSSFCRC